MYYELYVDSLFLLNFVMNLYLLLLVNQRTCRTATRRGLLLGAVCSSLFYVLPFLCAGPVWLRFGVGTFLGMAAMIWLPFRIRSIRSLRQITICFLKYSFLMGGGVLFFLRVIPRFSKILTTSAGVIGIGALLFLIFFYRKGDEENCAVTIKNGNQKVQVLGFWDTGNHLVEPISGSPVCVVEEELIYSLWETEPEFFRVIPYHSIGNSGYLKGFLIEELRIDVCGAEKVFRKIYIAKAPKKIHSVGNKKGGSLESVQVILNPLLLMGNQDGK